mgnify:CR=1 FL=1
MPSPTILTGLIVGAVLGFILQRGRFCITGAFRDVWIAKKTRWLTAFFIVIAVQAAGTVSSSSPIFSPTSPDATSSISQEVSHGGTGTPSPIQSRSA